MLIHINKRTCIQWKTVQILHYKADGDTTVFKVGNGWLSSKGNWIPKIEAALQVCAVAVYRTHYVLRA